MDMTKEEKLERVLLEIRKSYASDKESSTGPTKLIFTTSSQTASEVGRVHAKEIGFRLGKHEF